MHSSMTTTFEMVENSTVTTSGFDCTSSDEAFIADIASHLTRNKQGSVIQSASNCVTALREDPVLKGHICRNELTEMNCITGTVPWKRDSAALTDTDVNNIIVYLEKHYGLTNDKKIIRAIEVIANENRFHPVRDYLESLEWDGVSRIADALPHFLGAERCEYTTEVLKLFMLGAAERIYHPGCKFDYMPCLVGGQGAGKSTFFRFLSLSDDWFTDDMKDLDNNKVYEKMQGHWIIELAELSALKSTKTLEATKAFLSRQHESFRTPYEKYARDRKRQCVFGGTTNEKQFLPLDRTGNRRFLPVEIHEEKQEVHILEDENASREYIRQLWAEIMEIRKHEPVRLKLSPRMEAEASLVREEFSQEDTDAGIIYDWFEACSYPKVCSRMIYREALCRTFDDPKLYELRDITEIVNTGITTGKIKGWQAFKNSQRFQTYGTQRGWERIPEDRNSNEGHPLPDPETFEPVSEDEMPFR